MMFLLSWVIFMFHVDFRECSFSIPKNPFVCPEKQITPIKSYSFRMGLEPQKSYSIRRGLEC